MEVLSDEIDMARLMMDACLDEETIPIPPPPSKRSTRKDRENESAADNVEGVVAEDAADPAHLNDAFGDNEPTEAPFAGYNPMKDQTGADEDGEHLFQEDEEVAEGAQDGEETVQNAGGEGDHEPLGEDEYAGVPFTDLPTEVKLIRACTAVAEMHSIEADAEVIKKEGKNTFFPLREAWFELSARLHGMSEAYAQALLQEESSGAELAKSKKKAEDLALQINDLKKEHADALQSMEDRAKSAEDALKKADEAKKSAERDLATVRRELADLKAAETTQAQNAKTAILQWQESPEGKKWRDEAVYSMSQKISEQTKIRVLAAADMVVPGKKEEIQAALGEILAKEKARQLERQAQIARQSKERTEAARAEKAKKDLESAALRQNREAAANAAAELKKTISGASQPHASGGSKEKTTSGSKEQAASGKVHMTSSGIKVSLKRSADGAVSDAPSTGAKKSKSNPRPPVVNIRDPIAPTPKKSGSGSANKGEKRPNVPPSSSKKPKASDAKQP